MKWGLAWREVRYNLVAVREVHIRWYTKKRIRIQKLILLY